MTRTLLTLATALLFASGARAGEVAIGDFTMTVTVASTPVKYQLTTPPPVRLYMLFRDHGERTGEGDELELPPIEGSRFRFPDEGFGGPPYVMRETFGDPSIPLWLEVYDEWLPKATATLPRGVLDWAPVFDERAAVTPRNVHFTGVEVLNDNIRTIAIESPNGDGEMIDASMVDVTWRLWAEADANGNLLIPEPSAVALLLPALAWPVRRRRA